MFENISIIGRVVYIICVIEKYLFMKDEIDKWKILLDALWSYTEYEDKKSWYDFFVNIEKEGHIIYGGE